MFALGIYGWAIVVVAVGVAALLARHFRPAVGRHALVSSRTESTVPHSAENVDETIILGNLFGANLLNGYSVGESEDEDSSTVRPRPYLDHYWRQQEEQTTEIVAFGWFEGKEKENRDPALAMIG
jgi:hypothetical protein